MAIIEQTSAEALEQHIPGRLVANTRTLACSDTLVQIMTRPGIQETLLVPVVAEVLIVWIMSGCATVEERELNGSWTANKVEIGDFFLTKSTVPYELRWRAGGPDPFQVMHLYIGLPIIERAAREVTGDVKGYVALREVSGLKDPRLSLLLDQLRFELVARHAPSAMFVTGIVQSLAVHLVRNYRDPSANRPMKGELPALKLRRVIELMEARLRETFNLSLLAQEAGMSDFHFSRLFKRATGLAPSQYFIRVRMTEARRLLRETDRSMIEIGLDVGYSSPSHFAQVFRREAGVSPTDYRGS